MQNAITNAILREPSKSPENRKTKYQFLPEEPMISERPETNTNQVWMTYRKSSKRNQPCVILDPNFPRRVLEVFQKL